MKSSTFHVYIIAGLLFSISLGMIPAEANEGAQFVTKIIKYSSNHALGKKKTFDICVVGSPATFKVLKTWARGRFFKKRAYQVYSLASAGKAPSRKCNILYMGKSAANPQVFSKILTISNAEGFAANGGILQHRGMAFSVNLSSLRQAKLRMASDFLRQAKKTHGK